MLALFIAITMALLLLTWAETMPREEATTTPDAPPRKLRLSALRLPSLRRRKVADATAQEIEPVAPLAQARKAAQFATAPRVEDNDDIMARVEAMLEAPELDAADELTAPEPATATAQSELEQDMDPTDLPRITGFAPGDTIALEISGPAPRPEEISFEACAEGTLVLFDGLAELIIEGVTPEGLSHEILQFRDHAAA